MLKWAIHILFLVAGDRVPVPAHRSASTGRRSATFTAGIVVNAIYGVLQLVAAQGGRNLDNAVLSPLTGGASSINIYGAVAGQSVYRPNALTGDPNHLGIMLIVPMLVLLPVYLRLGRGHRLRTQLAVVLAFLFVVELATLSRSGLLGLAVGLLVLALPYRRRLVSRDLLVPLAASLGLVAIVVLSRLHFFETVIRSRFETGGSSTSAHFGVYDFIPNVPGRTPAVRARVQQRSRSTTSRHRQDELGAALVLRRAARRDRAGRRRPSSPSSSGTCSAACTRRAGARAGACARSATRLRRGCGRSPGA